jgi:hypothetical protein
MNMNVTIAGSLEELLWARVTSEVNAWRGACIQAFAQAEAAVTETLLLLSDLGVQGKAIQLRHLIGQRFEDLAHLRSSGSDCSRQTTFAELSSGSPSRGTPERPLGQ